MKRRIGTVKKLRELTPEDIEHLPDEVLRLLMPPHLRNPPPSNPELAYWHLCSQTGREGHLPCAAGSGCATCAATYRSTYDGPQPSIVQYRHPDLQMEARILVRHWYRAGAASTAPDDDLFLPFDPKLVP
jgi:hypothetical protein